MLYLSYTLPVYEYGKGRFYGGSGRGAVVQAHPAVPKIPQASSAFPFSGCLRCQVINLTPLRRFKAWGGQPPEARGISSDETHPTEPCSAQHGQPKHVPPTGKNALLGKARFQLGMPNYLLRSATRD